MQSDAALPSPTSSPPPEKKKKESYLWTAWLESVAIYLCSEVMDSELRTSKYSSICALDSKILDNQTIYGNIVTTVELINMYLCIS